MFVNYGDRDFFEHGVLVDTEHSDTEFQMLRCLPYPDEEDLFQFAEMTVDINESWIDQNSVEFYFGGKKETDPVGYAIACTDYYSWDNFGAINYIWDWQRMTRREIEEILRHRFIAADNLEITW